MAVAHIFRRFRLARFGSGETVKESPNTNTLIHRHCAGKRDQSEFPLRVAASLSEPVRGHGGAGPGEHQPVGPVRVPLGAAEARLVRRGVHHAQVCAGSRTAQLPLGFPEGRRSDHGHQCGAGEENTCCIDCPVVPARVKPA